MHKFRLTFILLFVIMLSSAKLNAQWVQVLPSQNGSIFALKLKGTLNFFAGSDVSGVFRTIDNGANWEPVNSGLTDLRVHSFAVIGTDLFTGTLGGVFLSTNNGTNWTPVNAGLTNLNVYPLAASGANLFAGTSNSGVFLSTDNGISWTAVNSGLTNNEVNAFAVSGTNLFTGTNGGVFLSTNNGTSWTPVNSGITNNLTNCFAVSESNLFVGTYGGGVFLSTNNGTSWASVSSGLTNLNILSLLAVNSSNVLAGTDGDGVFLSTDNGTSWATVNSGLTNLSVQSLAEVGTDLFAGTSSGGSNGVWRRPLSEMIIPVELESFSASAGENGITLNWSTATETNNHGFEIQRRNKDGKYADIGFVDGYGTTTEQHEYSFTDKTASAGTLYYRLKQIDFNGQYKYSNEVEVKFSGPLTFSLEQNYPNPFNPTTTINYSIPKDGKVTLNVYNIMGQQVANLINSNMKAGQHQITFDASRIASGIYYYRLKSNNNLMVKKMILLK